VFTARYGLIPYIKHIAFRLLKVKVWQLGKNLETVEELQEVRRTLVNCRSKTVLNWTFLTENNAQIT
jgi:hypothetical protein